jgi:CHAT domain-containing protein/Flp pilus assembly protein TadD
MLVHVLGNVWARCLPSSLSVSDTASSGEDLTTWIRRLEAASAAKASDLLVAADPQRIKSAAWLLLSRARVRLSTGQPDDWNEISNLGTLLLRVAERGYPIEFTGGQAMGSHARMLIGLGAHLSSPRIAQPSYEQAASDYSHHNESLLAVLAQLGAATAVRLGLSRNEDEAEISARLDAIEPISPEVRADLEPAVYDYVKIMRGIDAIRMGGQENLQNQDMPSIDAEAASLFESAAWSSLTDTNAAGRLARVADELYATLGGDRDVLPAIGRSLLGERRWSDAAAVLEQGRGQRTWDRDAALDLARAYDEMGRWGEARSVLIGLIEDPPGPADADIVQFLQNLALQHGDPEYPKWQALLAQLDPARTIQGQLPSFPAQAAPEQLRAMFSDGNVAINRGLLELPQPEITAQMTAAIAASSPDGPAMLIGLFDSDPPLAEGVMRLLGLQAPTKEGRQVNLHVWAGERYFQSGRFDEAASEYRAALDVDPDHAQALLYLGDTWYRRGAYEMAQAHFEESIAATPTAPAFRYLGDAIKLSGGSRQQVRLCYTEALNLDPSYGGALTALRQLDEAEEPAPQPDGLAPVPDPADPDVPAAAPVAVADSAPSIPQALRWSDLRSPARWRRPDNATTTAAHPTKAQEPPKPPTVAPESSGAKEPPELPEVSAASASQPQAGLLPPDGAGGFGDWMARQIADIEGAGSIVLIADDDEAFNCWLAAATPDAIARAIFTASTLAFQYEVKDRNLARREQWVNRQLQLAEALPADFPPGRQSSMELGRDRLLSDAYQGRASVLYARGRPAEAREWYERALELLSTEQDARDRAGLVGEPEFDRLFSTVNPKAGLLGSLSGVCKDLGDDEAAENYAAQERLLRSARPSSEVITQGMIESGDAAVRAGDFNAALGYFHRALGVAEESAEDQVVPRVLTTALNALGHFHHWLRLHSSALAYFNRARRLNEGTGNAVRLTWDYRQIGRVYRDRPDLGDAREAYEKSLINASHLAQPTDELTWTSSDGSSYQLIGPDRAWDSLLELGDLLESRGNFTGAAMFFGLATQVAEVVRASVASDAERVAIANQRIRAFEALTRLNLHRALAGGKDAVPAAEEAWRANEIMRARSFLDALGDDELAVPKGVTPALAEQEAAALERRRHLLASSAHGTVFWDELRQVQAELEAVWDHMLDVAPTAASYVEVRRSRPATAAEIRTLLVTDRRPIVVASLTALGADKLAVIAVRSDNPQPLITSQPADLARLARFVNQNLGTAGNVRELVADDLEDMFQNEMRPLTSALAEVSDPEDILVVCPFGALNYVPLAALRLDNTALITRNPMAVLPSASLARALRAAAGTPPRIPAAVFGDPTGDLPGAREEAGAVAKMLRAKPLLGADVTQAAVSEALTSAGIVHIAAHAHFDKDDPLSSGIRLSDGVLPAHHLITMSAPALSLVTLSACETGISQTNPAQELLGLTRALLFAGADSLVVSLWKVPDAATAEIVSTFYDRLQHDAWKVDALQAGVLAARERYGEKQFHQWAGFQLMGEWR